MKITQVAIVGGGSSGWMTAACLAKLCPHLQISLIESANIKTIGVGESTQARINEFLQLLDLRDEDWMPYCNATYKNAVRFTNFRENDGSYFDYPFTTAFDFHDKPLGADTWAHIKVRDPSYGPETFAEFYSNNALLTKYNRQTKNEDGRLRGFLFDVDTAYHLDSHLFGDYLKNYVAIPNKVKHIIGDVVDCSFAGKDIRSIKLADGSSVEADLFIDCSGFKSLLLGNYQKQEFISYGDKLINDSAWACQIPYQNKETEMVNVTNCTALNNGWVWNTPTWERIGTGYVFSSEFISDDDAKQEFIDYLGERGKDASMRLIKFKHGRYKQAWVNNVVGVGLSYAFLEPLESTGLWSTHESIVRLSEILNTRQGYVNQVEIDGYNYATEFELNQMVHFVSAHYTFSMREDTPYWKHCTQVMSNPQTNFMHSTMINKSWNGKFTGLLYIAAGMGLSSISSLAMSKRILRDIGDLDVNAIKIAYECNRAKTTDYIKSLPTHYEFLRDNIYTSH